MIHFFDGWWCPTFVPSNNYSKFPPGKSTSSSYAVSNISLHFERNVSDENPWKKNRKSCCFFCVYPRYRLIVFLALLEYSWGFDDTLCYYYLNQLVLPKPAFNSWCWNITELLERRIDTKWLSFDNVNCLNNSVTSNALILPVRPTGFFSCAYVLPFLVFFILLPVLFLVDFAHFFFLWSICHEPMFLPLSCFLYVSVLS